MVEFDMEAIKRLSIPERVQLVQEIWDAVAESPQTYRRVRGQARRIVLRRFPYLLFYLIDEEVEPTEVAILTEKGTRCPYDAYPFTAPPPAAGP